MKVGLFLGNMSPTEGGGYTLLIDQLSALKRLRQKCGHEIVLFHYQAGESLARLFKEFPSVNLEKHWEEEWEQQKALWEQQKALWEQQKALWEQQKQQQEHEWERQKVLWEREQNKFESLQQKIGGFSDFARRVHLVLYPPPAFPELPSPPPFPEMSPPPPFAAPSSASSWENRIYQREGVQFFIYLAPWLGEISMDIPFAVIVWDLQHRISPWFPEVSGRLEWNRREQNYAILLRRATVIYTGTLQGRDEIVRYYHVPPERIKVLPFAIPTFALEAARAPVNLDLLSKRRVRGEYLFYPAQFWAHKNHVVVLEACKIVRDKTGWNLGVVFAGADKGNLNYVREYASRLGLEQSTSFLGFVEQADLVELYKSAFCLVFPTFFGPDNLPPLEAFGTGCPVIASDIPGAREQLGDAAILFPPADEHALAKSILSLRNAETRARLTMAGRAATTRTTWDDYAQSIIDSVDEFAAIRRTWP